MDETAESKKGKEDQILATPTPPDFVNTQINGARLYNDKSTTDIYSGEAPSPNEEYRVFVYLSEEYEINDDAIVFKKKSYYYFIGNDVAKQLRILRAREAMLRTEIDIIFEATGIPLFYSTPQLDLALMGLSTFQIILVRQLEFVTSKIAYYESTGEEGYVLHYVTTTFDQGGSHTSYNVYF